MDAQASACRDTSSSQRPQTLKLGPKTKVKGPIQKGLGFGEAIIKSSRVELTSHRLISYIVLCNPSSVMVLVEASGFRLQMIRPKLGSNVRAGRCRCSCPEDLTGI